MPLILPYHTGEYIVDPNHKPFCTARTFTYDTYIIIPIQAVQAINETNLIPFRV